eukprot:7248296-Lingulodinium_polyedra.AAC.1
MRRAQTAAKSLQGRAAALKPGGLQPHDNTHGYEDCESGAEQLLLCRVLCEEPTSPSVLEADR